MFRLRFRFALPILLIVAGPAISQRTPFSADEQAIETQIAKLRQTPDAERGKITRDLALEIRRLPAGDNKVLLANGLANLSTEGDFGHAALQDVATTLADALRQKPQPQSHGEPDFAYTELAQLARYEHVSVSLDDPQYAAAVAGVAAFHRDQAKADFTLTDLTGTTWTRSALKGKVVLVNFWATWCPPCRKEMPDLENLYLQFRERGFIVLAISDETEAKVKPFIAQHGYTYPILLDPGRKVNDEFHIQGIPNSYIYDRQGKLVAQAIDMRTRGQFLKLLAKAGLDEELSGYRL